VAILLISTGVLYLASLPNVRDAESRVERILAAHHGTASGLPVPPRLAAAVVAIEDQHFYSNFVVNFLSGVARAAVAAASSTGNPGGATIPQQLAKVLYGQGSGLTGTVRQIGIAIKLSLHYSTSTILSMYLNAIYYGNGYWGDRAAARGYFHVSPYALTWAEAAMLAGLPQAPSAYDPLRHLALAKARQQRVLAQLLDTGALTPAQASAAYRAPLPLR
jgi:penicillin-binding protein 1A